MKPSNAACNQDPVETDTLALRGLELGEIDCAPGVDDYSLLQTVFDADLAAFAGQSTQLAPRYRAG